MLKKDFLKKALCRTAKTQKIHFNFGKGQTQAIGRA